KLCREEQATTAEGPTLLRRLFPLQGKGGGTSGRAKFHVTRLEATVDGDQWTFGGQISADSENNKDWKFTIALWLDGETGRGDKLPIENVTACRGHVQVLDNHVVCRVDSATKKVTFY